MNLFHICLFLERLPVPDCNCLHTIEALDGNMEIEVNTTFFLKDMCTARSFLGGTHYIVVK